MQAVLNYFYPPLWVRNSKDFSCYCFLRFSTIAGVRGTADAERDVWRFAIKFNTEEGNWDLVGNNTPVFFVRDPFKFSDFIHTQRWDPKTNPRSNTAIWDFWSLCRRVCTRSLIFFLTVIS